eukprot:Gb_19335 [translate_table: standard]
MKHYCIEELAPWIMMYGWTLFIIFLDARLLPGHDISSQDATLFYGPTSFQYLVSWVCGHLLAETWFQHGINPREDADSPLIQGGSLIFKTFPWFPCLKLLLELAKDIMTFRKGPFWIDNEHRSLILNGAPSEFTKHNALPPWWSPLAHSSCNVQVGTTMEVMHYHSLVVAYLVESHHDVPLPQRLHDLSLVVPT